MSQASRTFFSVIVPTHQRPNQLENFCLPALAGLDYPGEKFEVILVDDGSEKPPTAIVDKFSSRLDIRLVSQKHEGPAVARNKGASLARGRVLAFTDDDCAPAPDWLQKLESVFGGIPDCAVGGKTTNVLTENWYSTASQLLVDYLYIYYLANSAEGLFFTTSNLAVPVEQFDSIGGFDERFQLGGEDRELCIRLSRSGCKLIYAPQAIVYHAHDLSLRGFIRQQFKYGRGATRFRRAVLGKWRRKVPLEPASFYLNLLKYPLSQSGRKRNLLLCFLLIASQVINATGFFWEKSISHQ